jgi:mRNA-degrading endonuclease RelE of RelBE toxin-antitoxin system
MSGDTIEKLKKLPPDKQKAVEDFVDYLLEKYVPAKANGSLFSEQRQKNAGWAKGKVWMADDFNETPEDFKDYL